MSSRRDFLKYGSLAAGSLILPAKLSATEKKHVSNKKSPFGTPLNLRFRPYDLQLKHVFTIANNSRTTTPIMLTEIEYDGIIGYGEASMPPYLGESHQTAS